MKEMEKASATDEEVALAYRLTMASVHLIDKAVGQIVDKLKELGMYEDSVIMFTSDHGDYLGDCNMLCKGNLAHHNLLHVPFILKSPKGQQILCSPDKPMSNVDVLPTVFDMIGVERPEYTQGVNIVQESSKPMVNCGSVMHAERNISLYDEVFRYTYYPELDEEELYNHKEDPHELNNLASQPTKEVKARCMEMKSELMGRYIDSDIGIFNHYGLW